MIASLCSRRACNVSALLFSFVILSSLTSCKTEEYPFRSKDRIVIHQGTATGKKVTDLYYTTVEFPDGYDWREGSSYGAAPAEICLYKNGEPLVRVPDGNLADASADLHHMVDGHLYTQRCTGKGTVLACDGKEILRFPTEEILRGIVPGSDCLYTLWSNRNGDGFCLRKDSDEIMRNESGYLAGSLYDYSYLPCGALYRDSEDIVFCFYSGKDCFCVRNGRAEKVPAPAGTVLDMKVSEGTVCLLCRASDGKSLLLKRGGSEKRYSSEGFIFGTEGRIYIKKGDAVCTANKTYAFQDASVFTAILYPDGTVRDLSGSDAIPLSFSNPGAYISYDDNGRIAFSSPTSGYLRPDGSFYHMGGSPGVIHQDSLYVALNSRIKGKKPVLCRDGEYCQLDINGFISGIYSVSQ